nr:TolC family protein [Cetobacterium somerae]
MLYKTNNRLGKVVEVNEPRENIFFNGDVANKLGLYPNLIFLQNISNLKISEKDRIKLTLKNAVERALNSNFSLLKSKQDLETSSYNVKISNSSRLPQLNANMQYNAIDKRTSNFKMGAPTNSVSSYLELSQVIFNDQLNASVQIEKLALDSSRKQYEQTKLNILYYTASTYVNILQLNAQLDIQKSNYALLKESLEIAKLNYKVGAGGLQDVYRLESDVASSLANIANIGSEIKNQEIYLNTLLNLPTDNSYNYESLKDVSTYFVLSDSFNKNFSYGSDRSKKIENFLVQGAISNSNSLASLNNNIKAKERELSANKRERFLPKVSAAGKYYKDNMITPWGENSNKKFPDEYWEAGIVATLPLISGGEIYYNSKKIESEIQSLEYSWADSKNNLVQQVLQTYTELLSNYVQNYSTSTSSTVAKKNLDIVRNLYSEGTITVTDLLSAQNNALSQELNNVIQNFNLINSALKLENLYGKSSITMTSDEKLEILNNLNEVLEK